MSRKTKAAGRCLARAVQGVFVLTALCLPGEGLAKTVRARQVRIVSHVIGSPKAPNRILAFVSPSCAHCAQWKRECFPKIYTDWIRPGKASLEFRINPMHRLDVTAARLCFMDGGKEFLKILDLFSQAGREWMETGVQRFLQSKGYSIARINVALNSREIRDNVVYTAACANLEAAPVFFVGGRKLDGFLTAGMIAEATGEGT